MVVGQPRMEPKRTERHRQGNREEGRNCAAGPARPALMVRWAKKAARRCGRPPVDAETALHVAQICGAVDARIVAEGGPTNGWHAEEVARERVLSGARCKRHEQVFALIG